MKIPVVETAYTKLRPFNMMTLKIKCVSAWIDSFCKILGSETN
jgi:hypothetical protein